MITIRGLYYDGNSSRRQTAELVVTGAVAQVRCEGIEVLPPTPLSRLEFAPRLGNIPRVVALPGGGRFETPDNDGIDRLLAEAGAGGWVHRLESKWRYVAASVLVVIAFSWAVVQFGIPKAAEVVAFSLPPSVNREIDRGALELFDRHLFQPSRLDAATQARLAQRFAPVLEDVPEEYAIRVLFRSAKETVGANAFALPSGTIVFTDELVALAEHDEELVAVLAHEVGHVLRRHGLRQGIQGSALTLLAIAILGDVSSVSSIAATLPIMLTQFGYSRHFEREADQFAIQWLREAGVPVEHFANILRRLERSARCDEKTGRCRDGVPAYLSTHPPTDERLRLLREMG